MIAMTFPPVVEMTPPTLTRGMPFIAWSPIPFMSTTVFEVEITRTLFPAIPPFAPRSTRESECVCPGQVLGGPIMTVLMFDSSILSSGSDRLCLKIDLSLALGSSLLGCCPRLGDVLLGVLLILERR